MSHNKAISEEILSKYMSEEDFLNELAKLNKKKIKIGSLRKRHQREEESGISRLPKRVRILSKYYYEIEDVRKFFFSDRCAWSDQPKASQVKSRAKLYEPSNRRTKDALPTRKRA